MSFSTAFTMPERLYFMMNDSGQLEDDILDGTVDITETYPAIPPFMGDAVGLPLDARATRS